MLQCHEATCPLVDLGHSRRESSAYYAFWVRGGLGAGGPESQIQGEDLLPLDGWPGRFTPGGVHKHCASRLHPGCLAVFGPVATEPAESL